jgi:hypothetical protein
MQPAQRLCLAGLRTSTMLMRLFHQTDTIPVSAASIFTFRDEFTRHNRVAACRLECIHANKFIVCRAKNKADFSMGIHFYICRSRKKRQLHFFPIVTRACTNLLFIAIKILHTQARHSARSLLLLMFVNKIHAYARHAKIYLLAPNIRGRKSTLNYSAARNVHAARIKIVAHTHSHFNTHKLEMAQPLHQHHRKALARMFFNATVCLCVRVVCWWWICKCFASSAFTHTLSAGGRGMCVQS